MYWNGMDGFRTGLDQQQETIKDNYNKILNVFNYGTKEQAQDLSTVADMAIEKASVNIQRHSMYFNRKEYVKWIDDSYLLIGKAYFYKHDYRKARRTFQFVLDKYDYNEIRFEAYLWMINSNIQLEKYSKAISQVDQLKNEINKADKIPKEVLKLLPLVEADIYLHQHKYEQAKGPLMDALYVGQKKDMDARVRFILGQIHQEEEEFFIASKYYQQVIKKNPPYEMAFRAAINMAQCYDTRYDENSKAIEKKLFKMLKEEKNKEFQDQIYYALADLAFKKEDKVLGIEYLKLSVATSVDNNFQKVLSSLKLGELFFEAANYEYSQAYYDTATQVMPEDFPNYKDILQKTMYLTELVDNLIIVQEQDSLQMIAALPEEERLAIIDKIIEDLIEEERRLKELEEQMALNEELNGQFNQVPGGAIGQGKWYFYNSTAVNNGKAEFNRVWGKRKYEDLWRLSNKKSRYGDFGDLVSVDSIAGDSTLVASSDPHKPAYYLQDLPFSEDQLHYSDSLIERALYNLGFIYKDKLENEDKAIESFDSLISRFPETDYQLQAYFFLHRMYKNQNNIEQANLYRNLVLGQFPESDYAKLLINPNYYLELQAQLNEAEILYQTTYELFNQERYYSVINKADEAIKNIQKPPELMAKFAYLRALSIGKVQVLDSLKIALENIIAVYPDAEVTPKVQGLLATLFAVKDTTAAGKVGEIDYSIYTHVDGKQLFCLVLEGEDLNINALKVRVSDFNEEFFRLEDISISNIMLDVDRHLLVVGNFNDIESSLNYFQSVMNNEYVLGGLSGVSYDGFILAKDNYSVFYKDKDVAKYLAFFEEHYLKNN